MVRILRKRKLVFADGSLGVGLALSQDPQVVVSVGIIRPQSDSVLEGRACTRRIRGEQQLNSKAIVRVGRFRIDGDGVLEALDRLVNVASPHCNDAQLIPRLRHSRIQLQSPSQGALSGVETSELFERT